MKTVSDLRQALLDTIEGVKKGDITAQEAISISKNAMAVVSVTRMEMDYMMMQSPNKKPVEFMENKLTIEANEPKKILDKPVSVNGK